MNSTSLTCACCGASGRRKRSCALFGHPLDSVRAALARRRGGERLPAARRLRSRCASADLSGGVAGQRARVRAGRNAGQHSARLSSELDELGIVDQRMSFYMPLRLREQRRDGYSGFEARYYSLFPSYDRDMAPAVTCSSFCWRCAYRLALQGEFTHEQIPDDPTSESERRQPFFFSAAGLPAFYVHQDSRNQFLRGILRNCKKTRPQPAASRSTCAFRFATIADALLTFLAADPRSDVVEAMGMQPTLADLAVRCADKQQEASHRLIAAVVGESANDADEGRSARVQSPMAEVLSRWPAARTSARGLA